MLMHLLGHEHYLDSTGSATVHSESALEILRRRYASGRLTKEQYQDMKATLERGVEQSVSLPSQGHS
ncbi:MAG: hypothetical protein WC976_00645 [Caldisericia bacterium]